MRSTLLVALLASVLLFTACTGGSGGSNQGSGSPTVSLMTLYHPGGAKQAEGMGYRAPDNSVVRHGAWTDWYETGVVYMTGTYVQGVRSASAPWVEYNPDSSMRFDWKDH